MDSDIKYSISLSRDDFETQIKNHYHGDLGYLYSTPCVGVRTIWQCGCGYRACLNQSFDLLISEIINK